MRAVRHIHAVALPVLVGLSSPVAAQGEGRIVVLPGIGDARAGRIDRTVVSPFEGTRRIVVQPARGGGSEVVTFGTSAPAARPAPAPSPSPPPPSSGTFIDVGPLDPAPAAAPSFPAVQPEYLDIGAYPGDTVPPAPSSFPPD